MAGYGNCVRRSTACAMRSTGQCRETLIIIAGPKNCKYQYIEFFFVSVSPCINLTIKNSQIPTQANKVYQEVVSSSCLLGFEVSYDVDSFSLKCTVNGSWNATVSCNRKLII